MWHLINAKGLKKPACAKNKQLLYGMHDRSWSKKAFVDDWKGKKVKVMVVRQVSGEDNGAVVITEKPAII